jgi:hypothetical protein
MLESAVKYGFIFFIGFSLTVGGVCGITAVFGSVFGTL